jgi:bacteriocin-like protein
MSEDTKKPNEDQNKRTGELSAQELKQVTGGAFDSFLKIDGIPNPPLDNTKKK